MAAKRKVEVEASNDLGVNQPSPLRALPSAALSNISGQVQVMS
jgi:hypothetical protein